MSACWRQSWAIYNALQAIWDSDHGPVMDPELFEEYEYERVDDFFQFMNKVDPYWVGAMVFLHFVGLVSSSMTLMDAFFSLAPILIASACLHICKALERESVRRDRFLSGIITQLVTFLSSMLIRAWSMTVDSTLLQHRNYFMFFMFFAFLQVALGYVPDLIVICLVCPSMFISWTMYHINVGQFGANAALIGIFLPWIMMRVRGQLNVTRKLNVVMTRELQCVRESLEEVMSAQQSMLSTFFDASCVCDEHSNITEATPHMKQLVVCADDVLIGKPFTNLAPPDEQDRVRKFLDSTWKSGVAAAAKIETCLHRAPPATPTGTATPTASTFEAKIHCTRLPGTRFATESMKLWAHGGLFLGLQETSGRFSELGARARVHGNSAAPAERCQACLRVQEEHRIVFDVGSPSLQVVDCSPLFGFAGLGHVTCGLHEMLPSDIAEWLDEFVVGEVQSDSVGEGSKKVLQGLSLKLPASPGMHLTARSAQLEFNGLDDVDAEIPVALRLSGLKLAPAQGDETSRSRRPERMTSIREDDSARASEENASVFGHSETTDEVSTLWPDDSASQRVVSRHMNLQSGTSSDARS